MKLKAYMVYPGDSPLDSGCLLVFAETRNKARVLALNTFWNVYTDYIEMVALRKKTWDQYATGNKSYVIETNEELPKEAPLFYHEFES